eukprot:1601945-Rhodomonas_salina.1
MACRLLAGLDPSASSALIFFIRMDRAIFARPPPQTVGPLGGLPGSCWVFPTSYFPKPGVEHEKERDRERQRETERYCEP